MKPNPLILEKLTPEIQTIIWAGQGPLDFQTTEMATVNYLTNGLVYEYLNKKEHSTLHQESIHFAIELYGNTFWAIYLDAQLIQEKQLVNIIAPLDEKQKDKLLIINADLLPKAIEKKLDALFGFVEKL